MRLVQDTYVWSSFDICRILLSDPRAALTTASSVLRAADSHRLSVCSAGSRWRTRDIKYKIESWPSSVTDKSAVREVIRQSFQVWADVSSLSFQEVGPYEKAQIVIR